MEAHAAECTLRTCHILDAVEQPITITYAYDVLIAVTPGSANSI